MWGASLFLVTFMLVTSSGRALLGQYIGQTLEQYAAQSPYTEFMLLLLAVIALWMSIMMRRKRKPAVNQYVIYREVRGPAADVPTPRPRLAPIRVAMEKANALV